MWIEHLSLKYSAGVTVGVQAEPDCGLKGHLRRDMAVGGKQKK